ncbi:GNAT family N-acetyltransferase [Neolewinella persica]|uniref:GNAT family N-acetyltransferase n=1 Tax=Neolewinella persica TaxID=70998 RepID=UPI00036180CD|nr:GNAT family N-acetyltransferase [Neolewinella persica]
MPEAIIVREADINEVVALSALIPELGEFPREKMYREKVAGKPNLILIAEIGGVAAGFKVGYERDDYWYSWLGGVHPEFRRRGVARMLADRQDEWARERGYPTVTFKTLNRLRNMLRFGIDRGFNIIRVEEHEDVRENRIWMRREL